MRTSFAKTLRPYDEARLIQSIGQEITLNSLLRLVRISVNKRYALGKIVTSNNVSKPNQNKRAHHYVWQHYLKAWEIEKTFSCLMDNKIFLTNTKNIAQERDFYKLEELNKSEIEFIKIIFIKGTTGLKRSLAEGWINAMQQIFPLRAQLLQEGKVDEEIAEFIRTYLFNTEEDLHCNIETDAIQHLENLRNSDANLLLDIDKKIEFCHFLVYQYFRTSRLQNRFVESFSRDPKPPNNINLPNCWKIARHIIVDRVTSTLINEPFANIVFLNNSTGTYFISGDQPVINTFAIGKGLYEEIPHTEFYYPLSPTLAMLFTVDKAQSDLKSKELTLSDVQYYNHAIEDQSHKQLYAATENCLTQYVSVRK